MAFACFTSRLVLATKLGILTVVIVFAASCGQFDTHAMMVDGRNRSYAVYTPSALCLKGRAASGVDASVDPRKKGVPLVIALHCFHSNPSLILNQFKPIADRYSLAVVAPQGFGNSFNGGQCCGAAVEQNIDDVGFLRAVIAKLFNNSAGVVDPGVHLNPNAIYAFGHSNGGFMASLLSLQMPELRGFVALAGHVYNVSNNMKPQAVFLHWNKHDPKVKFDGCCGKRQCCCNIGEAWGGECVGAERIFKTWLAVNACRGSKKSHLRSDLECEEGLHCKYPTQFCQLSKGDHGNWDDAAIGMFLARDICSRGNIWKSDDLRCTTSALQYSDQVEWFKNKSLIDVVSGRIGKTVKIRKLLRVPARMHPQSHAAPLD